MNGWQLCARAMQEPGLRIKHSDWDDYYIYFDGLGWVDRDNKNFGPSFNSNGWQLYQEPAKEAEKSEAPYGNCPKCGSHFIARDRRPNGNTECWVCGFETTSKHWDELAKEPKTVTMWQPVCQYQSQSGHKSGWFTNGWLGEEKGKYEPSNPEMIVVGWIRHTVELEVGE